MNIILDMRVGDEGKGWKTTQRRKPGGSIRFTAENARNAEIRITTESTESPEYKRCSSRSPRPLR
jgi:hypothetical protein